MWIWALTSARTDNRTKKRGRWHGDTWFLWVIVTCSLLSHLSWTSTDFGFFCEFLGKIDNISSHISPIATLLVPNITNNSDLMGSFWSLWAKVWGNRKWLQRKQLRRGFPGHSTDLLYSWEPTPGICVLASVFPPLSKMVTTFTDGLFPGCRNLLTSALVFSPAPGRGSSTFERLKWISH